MSTINNNNNSESVETKTSSFGSLASFSPSALAACSTSLLNLSELYTEMSIMYGKLIGLQYQDQINEIESAANEAKNAITEDACAQLSQAISGMAEGVFVVTSTLTPVSPSPEMKACDERIQNAETYEELLNNRSGDVRISDRDEAMQSLREERPALAGKTEEEQDQIITQRLNKMKEPTYKFGTRAELREEEGLTDADILTVASGSDCQEIESNVARFKNEQEKLKEQERQFAIQRKNQLTQGVASMLRSSGLMGASGFTFNKASDQKAQMLANNAAEIAKSNISQFQQMAGTLASSITALLNQTLVSIAQASGY